MRLIYTLPDSRRERTPGVTLLGDAAHPDNVETALAAYEPAMFERSEAEAADSHLMLELCLGDRAAFGLIEFFNSALEGLVT